MPELYVKIPEVGSRVIDPVTQQVIESVLTKLGVQNYFPNALFIDNGRTAASLADDGSGNINLARNRCDVKVETLYNPSDQFWDTSADINNTSLGQASRYTNQYQTVFRDAQAKVSIQELTMPFGLTLSFTLTFRTYDAAQEALSAILSQNYGTVVNTTHDIVFSYPVSFKVLGVLNVVYKCKLDYQSKTLIDYISDMAQADISFNIRATDIGKLDPETQLVIKRQQIQCQALLECSQGAPEVLLEEKLPVTYKVDFTYRLQFGRPNILQITLPPVVDNTPLPNGLFIKTPTSTLPDLHAIPQTSYFSTVGQTVYSKYTSKTYAARLPDYDDFTLPSYTQLSIYKFNPLLIAISLLDPMITTVDLNNLGDVSLNSIVKTILAQHTLGDVVGFQGLFNISVFSNDIPLDPSLIGFDPETLLVTFSGSRIHNTYRFILSEQTNLKLLDPKWYPVLLAYRYFFPLTIARNLDALSKLGYFTVGSDDSLLRLIGHVIAIGQFEALLTQMITSGKTTYQVREYTLLPAQFADYICNTQALPLATDPPGTSLSQTLFDVFCDLCVANNFISEQNRPKEYLMTPRGYAYGPGQGGFSRGLNIPLRVFNVEIKNVTKG